MSEKTLGTVPFTHRGILEEQRVGVRPESLLQIQNRLLLAQFAERRRCTEVEPSRERIREALGGNLCRCTGYERIFRAIEVASGRKKAKK